MNKSFTCKIGGPAGCGIMSIGLIFSKTVSRSGYHLFDYFEYPSLIRGGHNVTETHFSIALVSAQEEKVDVLICLNKETFTLHHQELKAYAAVIYDPEQITIEVADLPEQNIVQIPLPMKKLIASIKGIKIMENNVALGAAVALFNLKLEVLHEVIDDEFADKGESVVASNQQAATLGFNFITDKKYTLPSFAQAAINSTPAAQKQSVLTGNDAIALGAISGGCKFYCAYPMTPSSSILHTLAALAQKTNMVVRHAEDEIAVINEAIGASFAGVRSMVGTSGGGFALMTEAISLAGITEQGLVILLGQRPGPATGMPTWTDQADLLFAINAGHGEFPKIVLAPGDVAEAFLLTAKAFNLADIYQTPIIILSDKYLSESHQALAVAELIKKIPAITSGKWDNPTPDPSGQVVPYPRYELSADGISPRIRPGTPGFYFQANSYEHSVAGHTTELSNQRVEQVNKRNQKAVTYLKQHFAGPKLYGEERAEITLVGWGSVKLPIMEVLQNNQERLKKTINFLHFTHLWPLDQDAVKNELVKQRRLILVENNATGQLGQLLRQTTGLEIKEKILKYDGRPFYANDLIDSINQL